mmetsp:Transcript_948/g.2078  ORF Transcript_948/g.2078 Transcript_948/m.2078 type:complete len:121 (-) Transcript_948:475-837(-)
MSVAHDTTLLIVLADLAFRTNVRIMREHINSDETRDDGPMDQMVLDMKTDGIEMVKLRCQIILGQSIHVKCLHDDGIDEEDGHTHLGCCLVAFLDRLVVNVPQPSPQTNIDDSNELHENI